MHTVLFVAKLLIAALVVLAEGVCWIMAGLNHTFHLTGEVIAGRRRLSGGVLRCHHGHVVPTEGLTWKCASCEYRYLGSVWRCENPECHAITPFVDCPVCRTSVRNPYRWEGAHGREAK